MVFSSSPIWTMSTEELTAHLSELTAPDQVYWDSRELKNKGQKFQKMDWSNWKKATKINGAWTFKIESEQTEEIPGTSVESRIKLDKTCFAIDLSESEKQIYTGCGYRVARFDDAGTLVELFNPANYADITAAITAYAAWYKPDFNAWLVMCSGQQLCVPEKIFPSVQMAQYLQAIFSKVFDI